MSTSTSILGQLIAKGHINSDYIGNVSATPTPPGSADATVWTINSDFIWEGDPGLGNPTFEFESLPYTITITHGGASSGSNTASVIITDAAIGSSGNDGLDTEKVTTGNITST